MRRQITAGLNMAVAGIPWWTTDIGGFFGGDSTDPAFHELLVRWFEYGTFCPVMRPLFYDHPEDAVSWEIEDEYMFGPDILVVPVTWSLQRERIVYLPKGKTWTNAWTGETIEGGKWVSVPAPLEQIPLFTTNGYRIIGCLYGENKEIYD